MLFDYKAVSIEGRMVFGRIDAINIVDLEMRLKRMDLDLVTGNPVDHRKLFGARKIPRQELINFCFHLDQLARSGVPILEGLGDLRDSIENPRFREVIAGLIEGIEGGQTLSLAMADHPNVFSQVFVSLIRAGEATGQLPEVLSSLNESLKWEDELASHTKKLLMYPAFVATIVLSATFFLMIYMVPQLKMFVKNMGQVLPMQTQILFFISDVLVNYWALFIIFPIIAVVALQLVLRSNPLARFRLDKRTATGGDHLGPTIDQPLNHPAFAIPKLFLAILRKDFRNGAACRILNRLIRINEWNIQCRRQPLADRRLAAPHHPDQCDRAIRFICAVNGQGGCISGHREGAIHSMRDWGKRASIKNSKSRVQHVAICLGVAHSRHRHCGRRLFLCWHQHATASPDDFDPGHADQHDQWVLSCVPSCAILP